MLRDYYEDKKLGYLNIAGEECCGIDFSDPSLDGFRHWVKTRVSFIENKIKTGKEYIFKASCIRIQLIALLYCLRYEAVVRQIKANGFVLKREYPVRINDAGHLLKTLFSILYRELAVKFAVI